MNKIVFVTLSSIPPEKLKTVSYAREGNTENCSSPTKFPGIALLEHVVRAGDRVKLVMLYQTDADSFWKQNREAFLGELGALSARCGVPLSVSAEIGTPMNLGREHQIELFRKLCAQYEDECEVYLDIGSGAKSVSIVMFASLCYAEKFRLCNIEGIDLATPFPPAVYDVRSAYELLMFTGTIDGLSTEDADRLINDLK